MDNYEELQRKLAEMVVFLRGDTRCHEHPHFSMMLLTNDGPLPWHGPICEIPIEEQKALVEAGELASTWPCEWSERRKQLVDEACEMLGSADMTGFL